MQKTARKIKFSVKYDAGSTLLGSGAGTVLIEHGGRTLILYSEIIENMTDIICTKVVVSND